MDKKVIEKLAKEFPNDMELGREIRKMVWEWKETQTKLGYGDAKIFESPDGGKMVYERPLGGDISQRKLVTSDEN